MEAIFLGIIFFFVSIAMEILGLLIRGAIWCVSMLLRLLVWMVRKTPAIIRCAILALTYVGMGLMWIILYFQDKFSHTSVTPLPHPSHSLNPYQLYL